MTPKVSIIVNCYNGRAYLKEAIDSVYAQTFQNWEIVFWDNASTDGSGDIVKQYDERIRYIRNDSLVPLGAARNAALKEVRGEYIAFLDVDDYWPPNKLDLQVALLDQNPQAGLAYAGIEEVSEDKKFLRRSMPIHPSGFIFPHLLNQFEINMVTPVIRKSVLEKFQLNFDGNIHASEEYNLFMRIAARCEILTQPEILGYVRVRKNSLTTQSIAKWAVERFYTLDQIKREIPGIEKKFPLEFAEAYARGDYYRARYLASLGDAKGARAALLPATRVHKRYLALYLALFLPKMVWEIIHSPGLKRTFLPALMGLAKS